jgi:hypothetical protein
MHMRQHNLAMAGALAFLCGTVGSAVAQSGGKAAAMTDADVTTTLQAAGYTNIHAVEREGKHFDADATAKDGTAVHLHVDARTGAVARVANESEEEEEKEEHHAP